MLNFLRNCKEFSKVTLPFYIPPEFHCSISSPTLSIDSLFNFDYYNEYVLVPFGDVSSFGNSHLSFCFLKHCFFFMLLNCMSSVYILGRNSSSDICITNIFKSFCALFFIFLNKHKQLLFQCSYSYHFQWFVCCVQAKKSSAKVVNVPPPFQIFTFDNYICAFFLVNAVYRVM